MTAMHNEGFKFQNGRFNGSSVDMLKHIQFIKRLIYQKPVRSPARTIYTIASDDKTHSVAQTLTSDVTSPFKSIKGLIYTSCLPKSP